LAASVIAPAQTTEFTFQGNLRDGANPANANYDFEFALFDAVSAGTQLGSTLPRNAVVVSNGAFSVKLDFGAQFPGANRFLEIRVRLSGQPGMTTLAPRQQIANTPYAVRSLNAGNADTATNATNAGNATNATNATTAATATNALQLGGVAANQYVLTGDARLSDARNPLPNSSNYIQNQNAAPQASSNFHVSGTGTANILNAGMQFNIGGNRILSNSGLGNLFAGVGAGATNAGNFNAFFGFDAGPSNATGTANAFFGANAGSSNTNGGSNAFFGFATGQNNTMGNSNAFFGREAGRSNSTGIDNTFFGRNAGLSNTAGSGNAFFGRNAGFSNDTGSNNTMIGANSNFSSPELSYATAIGADAVVGANNTIVMGRSGGQDTVQIPGNLNVAGNIAGRGTLPWQVVQGLAQQAQSNIGYLATNDAQVTITLPANPNVGDIVRASGSGIGGWKVIGNPGQFILPSISTTGENWIPHESNRNWQAVASSADGTKLVAAYDAPDGKIFTSNDSGASWVPRSPLGHWTAVASSADGTKLVATTISPGQIYVSSDSGATWTINGPLGGWFGVASSADGQKLVAAPCGGQIHTSSDFGVTWTPRGSSKCWSAVASSADGTKLIAAASNDGSPNQFPDRIYLSNDSGVTWTPLPNVPNNPGGDRWWAVASSGNGATLIAISQSAGSNWVSTDSGVSWTRREIDKSWYRAAASADGTRLVSVIYNGQIYTSIDAGVTWRVRESVRNWNAVASSDDGRKLIAAGGQGQIYTATILDVPNARASYVIGGQFSSIELQYVGGGLFLPISQVGSTVAFY
jgi:hypothetical protein